MKIADKRPVLTVAQLKSLPEFGERNSRQQEFLLLIAAGATPLESVAGAYNCKSKRSGDRFLHDLVNRQSMQVVLSRLYGQGNKAAFLERIEKLIRKGSHVTEAELNALVLYGVINDFLPPNYSPVREQAKLGKV